MQRRILIIILTAYILLAVIYSFATPLWEAPDEPSHYLYIQHLATYGSLPPPAPPPKGRFFEHGYATSLYEWYQPPLYYALVAPQTALVKALRPDTFPQTFPPIDPTFGKGGINLFDAPPDRTIGSLLLAPGPRMARLFSILLGLLTLLATYRLALTVSPSDDILALTATGFLAFIPQFTFITGYITNDNLADLMSTLCLLAYAALITRPNARGNRQVFGAGLLVSLALLTKLSLLFLLPLGILCLLWRATQHRSFAQWVKESALFTCTALSLPILGLALLPDMQTQLAFANMSLQPHPRFLSIQHIGSLWTSTHTSFWGRFGWMNVATPEWIANTMDLIALVGLSGSVYLLVHGNTEEGKDRSPRQTIILLWVTCCLVLIGFIRFNLSTNQPQGRLLFPALSAFAILVSQGLLHLAGRRFRWAVGFGLVILTLGVNLVSLFGSQMPAYD